MKNFNVALQLYSIREEMKNDMDYALKNVKQIGYDYVEFAGYFGKSAEEVREILDAHELKCVSVHQVPELILEQGQKAIDYIKIIGAKFCAIPHYDINKLKGTEAWEKTVNDFTIIGNKLKENGIQLVYHNHDFEFNKVEGKFILDWIYETVPSDILQPQIDTCWVRYAGYDPAEYILKYSNKTSILHLKDYVCNDLDRSSVYALIGKDGEEEEKPTKEENRFEFRPVGYGVQDFPKILEAAEKAGVDVVVVEQDVSVEREAMESAKMSREYLKSLGI